MNHAVHKTAPNPLNQRLAISGLRFTPQREHVYSILLGKQDHPTAEEVFIRAKQTMPDISIATIYNCLDALVTCGLVRQVQVDRMATRYCPNMEEHGHFYCEECKGIFDLALQDPLRLTGVPVPAGYKARQIDVAVRGVCAQCAAKETN